MFLDGGEINMKLSEAIRMVIKEMGLDVSGNDAGEWISKKFPELASKTTGDGKASFNASLSSAKKKAREEGAGSTSSKAPAPTQAAAPMEGDVTAIIASFVEGWKRLETAFGKEIAKSIVEKIIA